MNPLTDIQDNIEKLRSLQESLHDLCTFISTLDLTSGAKEETLIHGITELKEAFANVDLSSVEQAIAEVKNAVVNIDLSPLAKEDTLAQGISSVERKVEEVSKKIDNLNSGDGGDIGDKLQQIIDANILKPNLQDITFVDGEATNDVAALLVAGAPSIVRIGSETMNKGIRQYAFYGCSSLREVNFPLATSIGANAFISCSSLREVNFPLATSIGANAFQNCSSLREVNFPLATSIGANAFSSCDNIIKLTLGVNLANSINLSAAYWNPTKAYSKTSRSLVPEDVQAEHPLWYNLDYLLYNIRECIAANLPDRTGQSALTITFGATMKGHINNSEETVDAFTSKNWTIA